jgi:hypothetical protein
MNDVGIGFRSMESRHRKSLSFDTSAPLDPPFIYRGFSHPTEPSRVFMVCESKSAEITYHI